MLPVVSEVSFFGAEHRPGRFSSRVSNFDIELYVHQYSQYLRCGSRYFNQWIWAKNLKSVKTFRKSLVTYMKRFEDNNHVFSVRFCLPEAIFWLRGEMVGQKWVKSEIHHFSIVGYNSPIKCAIWVHNTILETSGHLLFSSKPENGQKWPKIST